MGIYPGPIENLIIQLSNLPTVGRKSAQRLAYKIVDMETSTVDDLARALLEVNRTIKPCQRCGNLTDRDICSICSDTSRDSSTVTVVEDSSSVVSLEKTKQYNGLYHVIGGVISPRDNVTPKDLNIESLLERLEKEDIKEVILAISPTTDGDTTTSFLGEILRDKDVNVTRIANGIPIGVNLEYYDEMSIFKALQDRRSIR